MSGRGYPMAGATRLSPTANKSIIEVKNPRTPFFDKLKTFIKPNNSIIIAGDKYNDTPQINRSCDYTVGNITLREKSISESVTANSTLCDRTSCPQENSSDISNDKSFALSQQRYESIDPFATKSQLNRIPESFNQKAILNYQILESEQVQENLPEEINQITLNDSANIEQALDSLKFSHPYSTSRKFNWENPTNNLPSERVINNLPNNNLPTQPTKMNLPTNQQISQQDALEIVPYFDGSSKVTLTIFIEELE